MTHIPQTVNLKWPKSTELLGLKLTLKPEEDSLLLPKYSVGLHAWFLDQVRESNPDLSEVMHDNQTEKNFTLSRLQGSLTSKRSKIFVQANQSYQISITALSQPLATWLGTWVKNLPDHLQLFDTVFCISDPGIELAPLTYSKLTKTPLMDKLALNFLSPTSFRSRGHHLPLPIPRNLFHSYLRRWNTFSNQEVNMENFLDWVDDNVFLLRHQLSSVKTVAGKRGSITGFIGTIELGCLKQPPEKSEFAKLFSTLANLAPYCGTGHKTAFGLGVTRIGWEPHWQDHIPTHSELLLSERIDELTHLFRSQRKRQGKERALHTAQTWATILARREMGHALSDIADDLEIPYLTVKTYCKLARRAYKNG
ncbi:CRISPR-associated endoribonuclease Cas6 [Acaryochloris sp. IP29b_bin.137]|uniref:CRISPR-associated endoribonuclease Cas6 n=1 Tax=Acaryochloris sp. IP29b_bin.137 TaxID=2969217 RepID=UPI0026059FDA|nr:CRISPR-associated endoribonuclease Cas6 [Acaryochloris sp. IP29b_bin.137]